MQVLSLSLSPVHIVKKTEISIGQRHSSYYSTLLIVYSTYRRAQYNSYIVQCLLQIYWIAPIRESSADCAWWKWSQLPKPKAKIEKLFSNDLQSVRKVRNSHRVNPNTVASASIVLEDAPRIEGETQESSANWNWTREKKRKEKKRKSHPNKSRWEQDRKNRNISWATEKMLAKSVCTSTDL